MTVHPSQLPDLAALVPCDSASPQVVCQSPAEYRVTMHPPRTPADTTCGRHVALLCRHCCDVIVNNIRRTLAAADARRAPQPVCPICDMRFHSVHDIVREVEKL